MIVYSQWSKLKNRENFTLEASKELEPMIDSSIQESIPLLGNFESLKFFELSIALRKPTRSCTLHSSLDLSHRIV